jgi:hypothetical protein
MRTRSLIAALLLAPALVLGACKQDSPPAPSTPHTAASTGTAREDVYTGVRGVVAMLPIAGNPNTELKIQHEQIPTFRNKDGEIGVNMRGVPGMASMTMPFPVGDGVDISTLAVGDKLAFDFTVYYGRTDGGHVWEITRFEKLDPETELDFTNTTVEEAATDRPHDHDDEDGEDHSGHDHP